MAFHKHVDCYTDGYSEEEIKLVWLDKDPVENNQPFQMAEYQLEDIQEGKCTASYITGEIYFLLRFLFCGQNKEFEDKMCLVWYFDGIFMLEIG